MKASKFLTRLALINLFVSLSAIAQPGRPDSSFNPPSFPNYLSIWSKNDGRLIVLAPNPEETNFYAKQLVRLNDSGSVDTTFKPALPANFTLITAAQDPNERLVIAGRFDNEPTMFRMRRLQADGSVDDTFQVLIEAGTDVDWSVGLLPASDSSIWVRGEFTNINGLSRQGLACIDSNGTVTPFQFGTNLSFAARMAIDGPNLLAHVAYVPPDSDAGELKLYRAFPDGKIDPAFLPDHVTDLHAIAADNSHRVLIAAVNISPPNNRIVLWRLLPNGSVDQSFHQVTSYDGDVDSLALQPDGKILVAGTFKTLDGIPRRSLARLNDDGAIDTTFDPGEWSPWGDWSNLGAYELNLRSDGRCVFATWVGLSSIASLYRFWGDQNLHFQSIAVDSTGLASLNFANTINSAWVLEASNDLKQWELVRTNETTATRSEESTASDRRFFRGVIR